MSIKDEITVALAEEAEASTALSEARAHEEAARAHRIACEQRLRTARDASETARRKFDNAWMMNAEKPKPRQHGVWDASWCRCGAKSGKECTCR